MLEKSEILTNAPLVLNQADQPWEVTVEGDSIIGRWRWKEEKFFSSGENSQEIKDFTFTVTLGDNGKWKELDRIAGKSASTSGSGAKLSASKFVGKTTQKSFEIDFSKKKKDGEGGAVTVKLDTGAVKRSIRAYLTECGWKKAGLFDGILGK